MARMSIGMEAKLPIWARDLLRELRNKIEQQENIIAIAGERARANGCSGKIIADGLIHKGFPLHDRALVEFHLSHGKVSCMLRENGTVLDLNSSGAMLIRPQAANAAYILVQP